MKKHKPSSNHLEKIFGFKCSLRETDKYSLREADKYSLRETDKLLKSDI